MGKLMVIDGLDGCGKSTQLDLLDRHLRQNDIAYRLISFPDYEQPSSALVKMYLAGDFGSAAGDVNAYAASSFYAVDRYASFKMFWGEDYRNGLPILAARYTTSNAIHQMAKMAPENWDAFLAWLEDYEYGRLGLPRPDQVVFLDMPPEISQRLMTARYGGDDTKKDIHERDRVYLRNCRNAALYAAEKCGWTVVTCGDGEDPFPPEEINLQLQHIFSAMLGD